MTWHCQVGTHMIVKHAMLQEVHLVRATDDSEFRSCRFRPMQDISQFGQLHHRASERGRPGPWGQVL